MPSSDQHAKRARKAIYWISSKPDPSDCLDPLVNEYFYGVLHMFEASAFDLPKFFGGRQHFESHEERFSFFRGFSSSPIHPFRIARRHYVSLYEFSRRARYLQRNSFSLVEPLKSSDLMTVEQSFQFASTAFADLYKQVGKSAPWLAR